MIARRIPKRWRYKIRRIYLHPGKLIAGIFLGQAFAFYGDIVVSLTCTAYHWGTFIEA